MLHPAVKIYIWVCLAAATQILNGYNLMLFGGILILLSSGICPARFFLILRRTRWILFSAFIIYSYAGSGDALWPHLGNLSPLSAGVFNGFMQLIRLLSILASLALLLAFLNQSQLITGLNTLAYPLCVFGKVRERMIIRLALTVQYAENSLKETTGNWYKNIEKGLQAVPVTSGHIEVKALPFGYRDWVIILFASFFLLGVWR